MTEVLYATGILPTLIVVGCVVLLSSLGGGLLWVQHRAEDWDYAKHKEE